MKKILIFLLLTIISVNAQIRFDDFEETGAPTGWFNQTGTSDFDYTAAPLSGLQSLYSNGVSGTKLAYAALGADYGTLYGAFMAKYSRLPAGAAFYIRFYINTTEKGYFGVNTAGKFQLVHGTGTATGTLVITPGTLYYVWFEYVAGSGANGVIRVYVSTDGIRPASAEAEVTNGSASGSINRFYVITSASTGGNQIIDDLTLSTTLPGDFISSQVSKKEPATRRQRLQRKQRSTR